MGSCLQVFSLCSGLYTAEKTCGALAAFSAFLGSAYNGHLLVTFFLCSGLYTAEKTCGALAAFSAFLWSAYNGHLLVSLFIFSIKYKYCKCRQCRGSRACRFYLSLNYADSFLSFLSKKHRQVSVRHSVRLCRRANLFYRLQLAIN